MRVVSPYIIEFYRTVVTAVEAADIFDDMARATSDGPAALIIRRVLATASKDDFSIPADMPHVVRAFADASPTSKVCVHLAAVCDNDDSDEPSRGNAFYAVQNRHDIPMVNRQVAYGFSLTRDCSNSIRVIGSTHTIVPGYPDAPNNLTAQCSAPRGAHTLASSDVRITDDRDNFTNPDPDMIRYVRWSDYEWNRTPEEGLDFASDLATSSHPWMAARAIIRPRM